MSKKQSKVTVIVGGQYGSEGKGHIVEHLANEYQHHVRTGGPNAGHVIYHEENKYNMQTIPCGWINPEAKLYIGAGAVLDLDQLLKEINIIEDAGYSVRDRLYIDYQAAIITEEHRQAETKLKDDIGSTGKGVGACRINRIQRNVDGHMLADPHYVGYITKTLGLQMCKVANKLQLVYQAGEENILLEGTQGSGLSLIHGSYPYCTSHDTNASQIAADAGVPPHKVTDVILVVRSYPIRVGGNSGYMYNEIDFNQLSEKLHRDVLEHTTVTKKVRRIGEFDEQVFLNAVLLNAPTSIALTFADYIDSSDFERVNYSALSSRTKTFIQFLEMFAPVHFIGTSPHHLIDRRELRGK